MPDRRNPWLVGAVLAFAGVLAAVGCYNTPVDTSEYAHGPAPLRMPSPEKPGACDSYEDSLTGGQVFEMYCSYCHNAPALAERPFANFRNVAAHMRVRANLTGKEYAKVLEFLRRWHDVPPGHPPVQESPAKRMMFSQPISELRPQTPTPGTAPKLPPPQPPMPEQAPKPQPLPPPQPQP